MTRSFRIANSRGISKVSKNVIRLNWFLVFLTFHLGCISVGPCSRRILGRALSVESHVSQAVPQDKPPLKDGILNTKEMFSTVDNAKFIRTSNSDTNAKVEGVHGIQYDIDCSSA